MIKCKDCKYRPENLVWADQCNKKKMSITNDGKIRYDLVVMADMNKNGDCGYYKKSFIKKLEDLWR